MTPNEFTGFALALVFDSPKKLWTPISKTITRVTRTPKVRLYLSLVLHIGLGIRLRRIERIGVVGGRQQKYR